MKLVFFLLESIFKSATFFRSEFVYFIKPPITFHPAAIFHPLVTDIIDFVCNKSNIAATIRPLIPRIKADFDPDLIHPSVHGSDQKFFMFTKLMEYIQKESLKTTQDFFQLARDFNKECSQLESERCINLRHPNEFTNKRQNSEAYGLSQKERAKFERKYFKSTPSGKILAVVNDTIRRIRTGEQHQKLFACHFDSLGRDFYDGSEQTNKSRLNYTGYYKYPALYSICPGAMAYHFCMNFESSHFLRFASNSAFVAILGFGVNEMLTLHDGLTGSLCNKGLINDDKCTICKRFKDNENKKKRKNKFYKKKSVEKIKPHVLPDFCDKFRLLDQTFNFGLL